MTTKPERMGNLKYRSMKYENMKSIKNIGLCKAIIFLT